MRVQTPAAEGSASLERLIELEDLGLEVLHPGGLDTTAQLAEWCRIEVGSRVLDVASGTGETVRFLAVERGARVWGIDRSATMIRRSRGKVREIERVIGLVRGDAHVLPFRAASFDVAMSECTLSLLDKERAIAEMIRVVRPGGHVGFHEICWKESAPVKLRDRLTDLEGERPQTLQGWADLLQRFDVRDVRVADLSALIPGWMGEARKRLGAAGQLGVARRVLREWGLVGLWRILRSARLFASPHLGYGMVTAAKR